MDSGLFALFKQKQQDIHLLIIQKTDDTESAGSWVVQDLFYEYIVKQQEKEKISHAFSIRSGPLNCPKRMSDKPCDQVETEEAGKEKDLIYPLFLKGRMAGEGYSLKTWQGSRHGNHGKWFS